jgi:hypothetical protein
MSPYMNDYTEWNTTGGSGEFLKLIYYFLLSSKWSHYCLNTSRIKKLYILNYS